MKKTLVIGLAAAFVLTFAVSAMAAEITWKGEVRTMGLAYDNLRDVVGAAPLDDNGQLLATRLRLLPTIAVDEKVQFIGAIEMGDLIWGTNDPVVGTGGGDRVSWEVKNAYMSFKLPTEAVDATVHAGLGPFWTAKGFINGLDVAFIRAFIFKGPWFILPGWAKAVDDVSTATGIGGTGDMDVGFFGVWYLQPISVGPAEITSAYFFLEPVWERSGAFQAVLPTIFSDEIDWYWLSPGLTLKSGPIDVAADFAYLWGTDKGLTPEVDYRSYALDITPTYAPEGAPYTVKGHLAYASGDDPDTDEYERFFGAAPNMNYTLLWGGKFGDDRYLDNNANLETPMVVDGTTLAVAPFTVFTSDDPGFPNGLLLLGGSVEYRLTEAVSVNVGGAHIRAAEENPATGEATVGTEIDAGLTWKLYDALSLKVLGGYMAAGEYGRTDADAPWMVGYRLDYSF